MNRGKERKSVADDDNESRAINFSRNRLKWPLFHRWILLGVPGELQSWVTFVSFVSFERISTEEVGRGFDDATIFVDGAKFFWRKREFAAECFLRRDRCLGKIDAASNCSLPRAARVLAKVVSCPFAFSFSFTRGFANQRFLSKVSNVSRQWNGSCETGRSLRVTTTDERKF